MTALEDERVTVRGRGWRWLLPGATVLAAVAVAAGTGLIGPTGAVFGSASSHPPSVPPAPTSVRIVGLGDSIPAAYGCTSCAGFLDLYADTVTAARSMPATVTNFAVGGWTTADLLASVTPGADDAEADPDGVTHSISQADIVTVMIGANDYDEQVDTFAGGQCGGPDGLACFSATTEEVTRDLTTILERIRQLRDGRPTTLQVLGYWDVFPDGDFAEQAYGPQFVQDSAKVTQLANAAIKDVAQTEQACYVDLFAPFKGPDGGLDDTSLLIDDGEHPNQAGHQKIADALAATPCAPIVPQDAAGTRSTREPR
jgi:lysophospholipase L1-like esterase